MDDGAAISDVQALGARVAQEPANIEARYALASALIAAGDPAAVQAMDDARTLDALLTARGLGADIARCQAEPAYAAAIAVEAYGKSLVAISSVLRGMAIGAGHADAAGLLNYGLSLQHQGRAEEASRIFRAAADAFPSAEVHQFLVYAQLFCEDGEARHAAEARAWADRYARFPTPPPHANPPLAGRRLRIGYVAPRFAASQLRQFITPVLEGHDPQRVEVVLYPADAATDAAWPDRIAVHPIGGLDDSAAAALIREDRIDVLNDCWGHTAGSRLGVFARKPAPVQTAWINFFQTTGLPEIDYVLHAACDDPPNLAAQYVEGLWPVAPAFTPFRPAEGRLPPAPAPALKAGVVTLGSFNHPAKISDGAIDAWAAVLRAAPNTRLFLKYDYFVDPVLQRVTRARFAARGVAPDRLVFEGRTSGEAYYRAFRQVDLMLDAWPAPGSTTTLEALSNGVPVLAMTGDPPNLGGFYARTLLRGAGLPELATPTAEAFVAKALELVSDPAALDALRARVRPGFDNGPIRDEAGFVRALEAAFAEMFERWRAAAG